jgi:hypothetical protein
MAEEVSLDRDAAEREQDDRGGAARQGRALREDGGEESPSETGGDRAGQRPEQRALREEVRDARARRGDRQRERGARGARASDPEIGGDPREEEQDEARD